MVNSLYMDLVMITSVMIMDIVIRGKEHPLQIYMMAVCRACVYSTILSPVVVEYQ